MTIIIIMMMTVKKINDQHQFDLIQRPSGQKRLAFLKLETSINTRNIDLQVGEGMLWKRPMTKIIVEE